MSQTEQLRALLVLHHAPNVGPKLINKLLKYFPNAAEILRADSSLLRKVGLPEKIIENLKQPDWRVIERDLKWAAQNGQTILAITEPSYPGLLKETVNAPVVLFVKGDKTILHNPQLAIVGSRNPTPMGKENACVFAKNLVALGITITSGLALGIDAASHRGALDGKGSTIAVMGTGLDRVYPQRNIELAEEIVASGGALVSEFPLGVAPVPANFPQRNRIISGLSLGTLVVEAALKSGSLITASFALEQGREIFAVPGSIHNPLARGCHSLLRQGAKLVESIDDILEELSSLVSNTNHLQMRERQTDLQNSLPINELAAFECNNNKLDYDLQKLLNCLGDEATSMEALLERSNLTISEITTMLVALEIRGMVKILPGGGYARVK